MTRAAPVVTHLDIGVQEVVARDGGRVEATRKRGEGGARDAGGAEERGHYGSIEVVGENACS